jgi:NitT/TauT family transport system substrate-binding protein
MALAAATSLGASAAIVPTTTAGAASNSVPPLKLPSGLRGSAPSNIKIGLAGGYALSFLPVIVALGAGYFNTVGKRFHTTISFDIYGSGATAQPAFLGGVDQWLVAAPASNLPAQVAGKDMVGVLSEAQGFGGVILGPAKYQASRGSNIASYGGPGNTWCDIQPAGLSNTVLKLAAAISHVNLANQNPTAVGSVAGVLPAIQSGACQLVSGDAGSASNGIIAGTAYLIDDTATPTNTIPLAGEQLGAGQVFTSNAFIKQYPKLSQAIVDAMTWALLVTQQYATDSNALYAVLPQDMTSQVSLGSFAQQMQIYGSAYSVPAYNNGEFPVQSINDSVALTIAGGSLPVGTAVNPSQAWTNKYVIQAYKDLGKTPVGGPAEGPATLPTTVGKPSLEAATAYATLIGGPVPANTGPAPMGAIKAGSSSTTTTSTTAA